MSYKLKICGMTQGNNIHDAETSGADIIGLIFYPQSPRYVSSRPAYLPVESKTAGVFVNESLDIIITTAKNYRLDYIQLHGTEQPCMCNILRAEGFKVIKAFPICDESDLIPTKEYEGCCDLFLFDTKTAKHGGSGVQFNWDTLKRYNGKTPFLLSGGISIDNIEKLKSFSHPALWGYDINSRFETAPGIKDIDLIRKFIKDMNL